MAELIKINSTYWFFLCCKLHQIANLVVKVYNKFLDTALSIRPKEYMSLAVLYFFSAMTSGAK